MIRKEVSRAFSAISFVRAFPGALSGSCQTRDDIAPLALSNSRNRNPGVSDQVYLTTSSMVVMPS